MSNPTQKQNEYNQLVSKHYASLYRFAYSLTSNEADACDLTQQTFYIWLEKGHQLRQPSKVKTWLFTTLYREFLHTARKISLVANDASAIDGIQEAEELQNVDPSRVFTVIRNLEESYRTPLILFYMREHSYMEIAEILEVPIGTVKSRISRGKKILHRLLESNSSEFDNSLAKIGAK